MFSADSASAVGLVLSDRCFWLPMYDATLGRTRGLIVRESETMKMATPVDSCSLDSCSLVKEALTCKRFASLDLSDNSEWNALRTVCSRINCVCNVDPLAYVRLALRIMLLGFFVGLAGVSDSEILG
jgi:hypothetical protein